MQTLKEFFESNNDNNMLTFTPASWSKAYNIPVTVREQAYALLHLKELYQMFKDHLENGNSIGSLLGLRNAEGKKYVNERIYYYLLNCHPDFKDLIDLHYRKKFKRPHHANHKNNQIGSTSKENVAISS